MKLTKIYNIEKSIVINIKKIKEWNRKLFKSCIFPLY